MNKESKRILIVDDERNMRDLFVGALTSGGHQISTASNASDAIEILKSGLFDLVISDVRMPYVGGPEFYLYAVADYPYLKDRFLFVTGCVTEELGNFFKRFGLNCIEKPVRPRDFLKQVDMLLLKPFQGVMNKGVGS